jgi:hypothetical protein
MLQTQTHLIFKYRRQGNTVKDLAFKFIVVCDCIITGRKRGLGNHFSLGNRGLGNHVTAIKLVLFFGFFDFPQLLLFIFGQLTRS